MKIISALLASKKSSVKVFRSGSKSLGKAVTNKTVSTIENQPKTHNNATDAGKQQQSAITGAPPNRQDGSGGSPTMYRENEMKIQMLSKPLYDQIFKNENPKNHDAKAIKRYVIIRLSMKMCMKDVFSPIADTTKCLNRMG